MNRLIETFLAEDNTGNQYRIEHYQKLTKHQHLTRRGESTYQWKGNTVTDEGDDLFHIITLDTEVKRIRT